MFGLDELGINNSNLFKSFEKNSSRKEKEKRKRSPFWRHFPLGEKGKTTEVNSTILWMKTNISLPSFDKKCGVPNSS